MTAFMRTFIFLSSHPFQLLPETTVSRPSLPIEASQIILPLEISDILYYCTSTLLQPKGVGTSFHRFQGTFELSQSQVGIPRQKMPVVNNLRIHSQTKQLPVLYMTITQIQAKSCPHMCWQGFLSKHKNCLSTANSRVWPKSVLT